MESPISSIEANLFMADLESQAIETSPSPPVLSKRYVHDTHTVIKKQDKNSFLEHMNSINPSIEYSMTDVTMPVLGILITSMEEGIPQTSVLRKPTYTDLYLHLDSQHTIPSK